MSQEMVEWSIGDKILDLYEVTGILGEGSTSRVYKVRHKGWDTDLAVKTPRPEILERVGGELASDLAHDLGLHPHIVSFYYVRMLEGIPRVFTEYIEGGSLSDWIENGKLYEGEILSESNSLTGVRSSVIKFAQDLFSVSRNQFESEALERILDVAIQLAWGLHYAHNRGLIHWDVKPGNVMMAPDGTAKLKDLNLPVCLRGVTQAYCSPEQMLGKPLTHKTDIWSWGLTVLEMFAGERTWHFGSDAARTLEEYSKIGSRYPNIPEMPGTLSKLLRRCLQRDPEKRPRDMLEIAGELQGMYRRIGRRIYARQAPDTNKLLADSLNNRALSYMDLGREAEAEAAWQASLEADPRHMDAAYNYGLTLWRKGKLTDTELLERLKGFQVTDREEGWRAKYLLMLIHLERGDLDSADSMLKQANGQAPTESEIANGFIQVWARENLRSGSFRIFEGHTDSVNSVCLSPDSRFALSGSSDRTLRLWEMAAGQSIQTYKGHKSSVTSVSFSGDGKYLLSGSWDRTLRLWDQDTGCCLRVFEGHKDLVNCVWLSTDGRYALSGSGSLRKVDNSVRLWEAATGRSLQIFEGHADSVNSVCLSGDGQFVLSGSSDNTLRLWEVATGSCLKVFEGHTDSVNFVGMGSDGRYALSGSSDNTLRLWEVDTGRCRRVFRGHSNHVFSAGLSADGRFALSGSLDGTLRLWEVATGRCLRTFEEQRKIPLNAVCLSIDGHSALTGSGIFGSDAGNILQAWELRFDNSRVSSFRLSPSRSFVESSQAELSAKELFKKGVRALEKGQTSSALSLIRRGRELPGCERIREGLDAWAKIASNCKRAGLRGVWPARTFEGHKDLLHSVCLSRGGRFALSGGRDRTIRLWEVATGRCLQTFEGHKSDIGSVCFSADAKYALSGSDDDTLRLWEVGTGRCLQAFEGHTDDVNSVCLSSDRRLALSGSHDRTVRLWETSAGHTLRILKGHADSVFSVCLSADDRFVLSGSRDMTIRLWEAATGRCLLIFKGHTDAVSSARFSNDGRVALSSSFDKTLRLWDIETGNCLRVFEGHTDRVFSSHMSADGLFAVSAGVDGTVRFWEVASGR